MFNYHNVSHTRCRPYIIIYTECSTVNPTATKGGTLDESNNVLKSNFHERASYHSCSMIGAIIVGAYNKRQASISSCYTVGLSRTVRSVQFVKFCCIRCHIF